MSGEGSALRRRSRGRTMGDGAVLRGEHVTRTYGSAANEVHALSDVSVELHAGELVMLRGPSGSGKTTLLNILGGLDEPTSGRVWLRDVELTTTRESDLVELRRHQLGFVFQSFALLPMLTAAENIEVPLRLVGTPVAERAGRVQELLESVGLSKHAAQRPDELAAIVTTHDPRLIGRADPLLEIADGRLAGGALSSRE